MATPQISITSNERAWLEGDGGTQTATFTVTRAGDLSALSRVQFSARHYGPHTTPEPQGVIEFAPGQTTQTISVTWQADDVDPSSNETEIRVNLSQPENAFIPPGGGLAVSYIIEDDGLVPILHRPNLQDGSSAADQALTGDPLPTAFYFDNAAGPTGEDTIQDFGTNDVLALTQQLADGDGDGLIPLGPGGTLDLPGAGGQLSFQGEAPEPDQGLRYLGQSLDGMFLYADAEVRPPGAQEKIVIEADNLRGDGERNVYFFDTALDVRLVTPPFHSNDDPAVLFFGSEDLLVTTVPLSSTAAVGDLVDVGPLPGVTGDTGPLDMWVSFRTRVDEVQYLGSTNNEGVEYYVYGLPGSAHSPDQVFDPEFLNPPYAAVGASEAAADSLDDVLGPGGWEQMGYDPAAFSDQFDFVFVHGTSEASKAEIVNFVSLHKSEMEAWVAEGNTLFFNMGRPDTGPDPVNVGFGVTYQGGAAMQGFAANPDHPIFDATTGLSWASAPLAWDGISGAGLTALITDESGRTVLAEKTYGAGRVMFGSLATDLFDDPNVSTYPQTSNLLDNIIEYLTTPSANTAPVAEPAAVSGTEDDAVIAGAVVATDEDEDPLTYSLVGEAPSGLTFNPDGTFSLTPSPADQGLDAGESRIVTFDYRAYDGAAYSNAATVTVTINGLDNTPVVIVGGNKSDVLNGTAANEAMSGGNGDDRLNGAEGTDTLSGGNGGDTLVGGAGNDQLDGGNGADTLIGGAGDDVLLGGNGPDRSVFDAGFGHDRIGDFGGPDVIQLSRALFADFAAVQAHSDQAGADVVIAYDYANTITLAGVQLNSLNSSDFLFV